MLTEIFFLNSDNKIELQFKYANQITDINGVVIAKAGDVIPFSKNNTEKMELYINGQTVSSDSGQIEWSDHKVVIDLHGVNGLQEKHRYPVSMKVFDPAHPKGQVILHPKMPTSRMKAEVVEL